MKLCPTYLVIQDDYTGKNTIVQTSDKNRLIKEIINKVTNPRVSFHVVAGFVAGESETTITCEYDEEEKNKKRYCKIS